MPPGSLDAGESTTHPVGEEQITSQQTGRTAIRIVVADDQTLVRSAIAMVLDPEEDVKVAAQTNNGREAIETVACSDVGIVPADVEVSVMDGIAATSRVRKEHPDVKILMVTAFRQPNYLRRTMEAEASGFVVEDTSSDSLASAVRKMMAGQRIIDPDLVARSPATPNNPLTEREQDVLRATSDGRATAGVSRSLFFSQRTVHNYLSLVIHKTRVRTHVEAMTIARGSGWL